MGSDTGTHLENDLGAERWPLRRSGKPPSSRTNEPSCPTYTGAQGDAQMQARQRAPQCCADDVRSPKQGGSAPNVSHVYVNAFWE